MKLIYLDKVSISKSRIYTFQLNKFNFDTPNQFCWGLGVSNYNKETAAALERTWKSQMADYKETIIAAPKDSGEFWEIVEYYGTPQEGKYLFTTTI